MFEIKGNPQLNKDSFHFSQNGTYPYFTRTVLNNGFAGYVDYLDEEHKIKGGCLAVGMIAMQFFYMEKDFYAGQFTKRAVPKGFELTSRTAQYFISLINKYQSRFQEKLVRDFEQLFNASYITLPTKNGAIDFDYMERFISKLQSARIQDLSAYLNASGLKEYTLSSEESEIIGGGVNICSSAKPFSFRSIFDHIRQGRRLKKEDQRPGDIPFVMSGTTNAGVVNHVSNPVALFPGNAITIDIFGNTFYRNDAFGAGDDTGAYWSEANKYSKEVMLFLAAAMHCAVKDTFSYGKKLRSSQSLDFKMMLPTKNGMPDFTYMETVIRAVQKLVILDVVRYAARQSAAAKSVIHT